MAIQILHLISSLSRGGRERQLTTIVANTDFEKYPTKIVYFDERENTYVDEYDLKKHCIKIRARGFLSRFLELHKLMKKEEPDVIYTWGNLESFFILFLNPLHRFRFINGSVRHGIRSKKFSHYFRTLVLHLSPHIVANSRAGLKANNLKRGRVLYNGIDRKFIGKLSGEEKAKQREALLPVASGRLLFISVANLVPYKDYFSILKALYGMKKDHLDFHYVILGDGPLRRAVEDFIKQLGLEADITLIGNVEDVQKYLQMADIFIHSSKGEGCSNAILEAMAAGLPVVASKTGGTPEVINGKNGILFEYKNISQLSDGLHYFYENPLERNHAGCESYNRINERFTISRMIHEYYSLIQNLS